MRQKINQQIPLKHPTTKHIISEEYEMINTILDKNPEIYNLAHKDLTKHIKNTKAGANGMTAEQVVKSAIIKQKEGYSYKELAFHLVDSNTFRDFCNIGICHKGFKKSALNSNIKKLSFETWEEINRCLMQFGKDEGIEKGRETRTDCTAVSSNIHKPSDSNQLWDCVRVLTRELEKADEKFPNLRIHYTDHTCRAKRRMLGIMNTNSDKEKKAKYRDLLVVTRKTTGYAKTALSALEKLPPWDYEAIALCAGLDKIIHLAVKIMDQTERRLFKGEHVPASEKVLSIFEPHTDIIIKDRRDKFFGHKICLTGGKSNLILDCVILEGNPADSTLPESMTDRLKDIYGQYPLKMSFDGGFASKAGLKTLKSKEGVKDICFSKKRGMEAEDMCRSEWVYKRLRNFRAGIESGISWLKRAFGLSVCTWKGFESFKSYVWASIVAANLTTLARYRMNV